MEVSAVRQQILQTIERAKRGAADRRAANDDAGREYGVFLDQLATVVDGGTAIDPVVVESCPRHSHPRLHSLTEREIEVLGLVASGRSNAGVATDLVISRLPWTPICARSSPRWGSRPIPTATNWCSRRWTG